MIQFAIASGPQTIVLKSPLPTIMDPVVLDGTTQPGWTVSPIIALDGSAAGQEAAGLQILAGSSTVRGIALTRFGSTTLGAITLSEKGGNLIEGNFVGIDVAGSAAPGNRGPGILVRCSNNTIGGTARSARNVVSGNAGDGIRIQGAGNVVLGNYFGTDAAGARALGNGGDGISVSGGNTIGGPARGAGNVVSGNAGLGISAGPSEEIQGNRIGTDAAGSGRLGNGKGGVSGGKRIGGSDGTKPDGPCSGACNLISDNHGPGIAASAGSVIQGNFIGTDASGAAPLGNAPVGISIIEVSGVTVGGSNASARNLISGNDGPGIELASHAERVRILGNLIGTDATGKAALPNASGITLRDGALRNTIGGSPGTEGNTIAFNLGEGVGLEASAGTGNAILGNAIYANGGLGIDLGRDGVTPNREPETPAGPNELQNFPLLTSVTAYSVEGTLESAPRRTFTVQIFTNQACDRSGHGEGQSLIGMTTVDTDESGHSSFGVSLTASPGQGVTATATDSARNTSEFSPCVLPTGDEPMATTGDSPTVASGG
jgi:hypothetical protein